MKNDPLAEKIRADFHDFVSSVRVLPPPLDFAGCERLVDRLGPVLEAGEKLKGLALAIRSDETK